MFVPQFPQMHFCAADSCLAGSVDPNRYIPLTATCYTVEAQNVLTVNIRPRVTKHNSERILQKVVSTYIRPFVVTVCRIYI